MEENQISPDYISSSLMMQALCNGGYLDEVRSMNKWNSCMSLVVTN